jgi:hypothetical protein
MTPATIAQPTKANGTLPASLLEQKRSVVLGVVAAAGIGPRPGIFSGRGRAAWA